MGCCFIGSVFYVRVFQSFHNFNYFLLNIYFISIIYLLRSGHFVG
jgi:hypothetical protein